MLAFRMSLTYITVLLSVSIPNNNKAESEETSAASNDSSIKLFDCLFKDNSSSRRNDPNSNSSSFSICSLMLREISKDKTAASSSSQDESANSKTSPIKIPSRHETLESHVNMASKRTNLDTRKFFSSESVLPFRSEQRYKETFYLDDLYTNSQAPNVKEVDIPPLFHPWSNFKERIHVPEVPRVPSQTFPYMFEIKTFGSDGVVLTAPDYSYFFNYDQPFSDQFVNRMLPSFEKPNDFGSLSRGILSLPRGFSSVVHRDSFYPLHMHSISQFTDNKDIEISQISRNSGLEPLQTLSTSKLEKNEGNVDILDVACRFELKGKMLPSNIPAKLCDYILIDGFVVEGNRLSHILSNTKQRRVLNELQELKNTSNVKLFASVKDSFANIAPFSSHRQRFVDSSVRLLKEYNFDGLDVDWEWTLGGPDKEEMASLLLDLKTKFNRRQKPYLLSATVSATVDAYSKSYDAPVLSRLVEFVNLKTYDFFYYHSRRGRLAHPCPLFPRNIDDDEVKAKNLAHCANFWSSVGMPKSKIMVTVPTYGRTYRLKDENYTELNFPATGIGFHDGIASYPQVCDFLKGGASSKFDDMSKVPYAFNSTDWVGFENVESVNWKSEWIKSNGYKGITVKSLNSDDWTGQCDGQRFPLLGAIYRTIMT